jgi:hypothetical protein
LETDTIFQLLNGFSLSKDTEATSKTMQVSKLPLELSKP